MEVKAKEASKWGQIFAAIWIAGWCAFKFIKNPAAMDVNDIIFSGVGIAGCFVPTIFSIYFDKFISGKQPNAQ